MVALGDSTTAPRRVGDRNLVVYADRLRDIFGPSGLTVINAGVGGNDTRLASARFRKDVLDHQPRLAVVQFGINDAAVDVRLGRTDPRVPLAEFSATIRRMVETLMQALCRVILMTPNPMYWTPAMLELYGKPPYRPDDFDGFNVLLGSYAEAGRTVTRETGCVGLDVYGRYQALIGNRAAAVADYFLDGMHPNDRGHALVTELLTPVVDRLLQAIRNDGGRQAV